MPTADPIGGVDLATKLVLMLVAQSPENGHTSTFAVRCYAKVNGFICVSPQNVGIGHFSIVTVNAILKNPPTREAVG